MKWMFSTLALAFSLGSFAGEAVMVGADTTSQAPLVYTLSLAATTATPIAIPNSQSGSITVVAHLPNGSAIMAGQNLTTNQALIYLLANSVLTVIGNANTHQSATASIAVDTAGTAYLTGIDITTSLPFIWKVASGASSAASLTLSPAPPTTSVFVSVATAPDGSVYLAGSTQSAGPTYTPLFYYLAPGSTTATQISVSGQGQFYSLAVDPDGTVVVGGEDTNLTLPLVYTYSNGTLTPVTNPSSDMGFIAHIAIGSNGTALLAGGVDNPPGHLNPIIWSIPMGTTTIVPLTVSIPSGDQGSLLSVAIGADGTAAFGGQDATTLQPLLYSLPSGSSTALFIQNPNSHQGAIQTTAVGSDGTALFGGADTTINASGVPIVYQLAKGATAASNVILPNFNFATDIGIINSIALFGSLSSTPRAFYRPSTSFGTR